MRVGEEVTFIFQFNSGLPIFGTVRIEEDNQTGRIILILIFNNFFFTSQRGVLF